MGNIKNSTNSWTNFFRSCMCVAQLGSIIYLSILTDRLENLRDRLTIPQKVSPDRSIRISERESVSSNSWESRSYRFLRCHWETIHVLYAVLGINGWQIEIQYRSEIRDATGGSYRSKGGERKRGKGWEGKTGNFAWALRPVTLEGWQGLQIADWIERLEFPGEGSIQFN